MTKQSTARNAADDPTNAVDDAANVVANVATDAKNLATDAGDEVAERTVAGFKEATPRRSA